MLRLVAGALALTLVVGLTVQAQATQRLRDLVDRSWRGTYDLVVSAPGAAPSSEALSAPLDTAAWTSSADRLSTADLDRIRAVSGVEVAAPLGDLGVRSVANQDAVMIGYPADGSVEGPRAFDLEARVHTDDGLGHRPVLGMDTTLIGYFSDDGPIEDARPLLEDQAVCDPAPPEPGPCTDVELPTLALGPRGRTPEPAQREVPAGTYWAAPWAEPDPQGNRMVVVDAAAEATLLDLGGNTAAADAFRVLAQSSPAGSLSAVVDRLSGAATEEARALVEAKDRLPAHLQILADTTGRSAESLSAVPVLATSVGSAPLSLEVRAKPYREPATRLRIEQAPVDPRDPTGPRGMLGLPTWELPTGGLATQEDVSTSDVSGRFGGLGLGVTVIPVPGLTTVQDPVLSYDSPRLSLVQETRTLTRPTTADGNLAEAAGVETASGTLPGRPEVAVARALPASTSRESAYYAATDDGRRFGTGDAPLLVSVGTLVPEPDTDLAGIAPLLTDVELPTTLVADPDGTPREVRLQPASTGFGLANQMPAAYVDAASAATLGLERPFSTVRVRVADVGEDLTPENLATIDAVAQQLKDAGFAVTTVAASSLSPRQFQVVSYRFDSTDGEAHTGPLGTVRQLGPELAASQRVSAAVGSAGTAQAMTVTALLTGLAGLCILAAARPRRRRAGVLALQGWTRGATVRRHLKEDAPTLMVLALTLAALTAAGATTARIGVEPPLVAVGLGATAVLAAAIVTTAVTAARPTTADTREHATRSTGPARPARTAAALLTRWTARTWPRLLTGAAYRAAVAVGAGLLVAVVLQARREAGTSLLAGAAVAQDLPFRLALGALAAVVGMILLVQLHRVEGDTVRAEAIVLLLAGWSRAKLMVRHLPTLAVEAAVAGLVAGLVLVLLTPAVDLPPVVGAAGLGLLLTLLITLFTRRAQLARAWKGQPA
ncbi:hypothetical protein HMPREF2863_10720 [Micrococcus sp. HMSC067E09]|uniref:hypothetical protein n=1 Tax=Micrococcus sp. HMSC067E09 TaxID=1739367 RepID=UPI0008A3FDEE|nr:hypothetical protein [Micrococcus sp. HMSC067E09]OFR88568.1 hypothetical protein HMPREF2863_10720 [Micrococcus sp. HMSC067E09]